MFESLSASNPVRKLLEPQSSYVIPFDDVLLLQWNAAAPPTSIASARQFLELIDLYARGRLVIYAPNRCLAYIQVTGIGAKGGSDS